LKKKWKRDPVVCRMGITQRNSWKGMHRIKRNYNLRERRVQI